jgi:hypothetical protein
MKIFLSLIIAFSSTQILAHGMNKLGPNQGYISMPGAFHTEVVPLENGNLKIYLLDINFENAVTADSTVELTYNNLKDQTAFICRPKSLYFDCIANKKIDLTKGKLMLKAVRQNVKASNVAEYQLPLSLK